MNRRTLFRLLVGLPLIGRPAYDWANMTHAEKMTAWRRLGYED